MIFKHWRTVDFCKKAEDIGASSFMHKPPILFQESLLVTSPLFQVVCLAISLKLDAMEAFIINVCFNLKFKSFIWIPFFLNLHICDYLFARSVHSKSLKWWTNSYIFSCGNSHGMSQVWSMGWSFKKMMEEVLVPLTLFWKSYLISSPLKDACLCIVVEHGSVGIFRIGAFVLCSGKFWPFKCFLPFFFFFFSIDNLIVI